MDKLYGGIDLHANNSVVVVLDEQDQVRYRKRLPNELEGILQQLAVGFAHVALVYLRGGADLIRQRLQLRTGHFMKDDLLESQLLTLEEPQTVPVVDVDLSPDLIVHRIKKVLQLDGS